MGGPAPVGREPYGDLFSRPMVLKAESVGFVLLSLLDLLISRVCFQWDSLWGGYEVNPVAAYVLRYYNVPGLVVYKFVLTAGVVVACQVIWHKYPRIARGILLGGCLVFCYVVIHSTWQLYRHTGMFPWW